MTWGYLNQIISNGLIAGKHQAHQLLSYRPVASCRSDICTFSLCASAQSPLVLLELEMVTVWLDMHNMALEEAGDDNIYI